MSTDDIVTMLQRQVDLMDDGTFVPPHRMRDAALKAVDEIGRLRSQVAELLPWAEAGANDRLAVSIGEVCWPAQELRARIEAGEFGQAP